MFSSTVCANYQLLLGMHKRISFYTYITLGVGVCGGEDDLKHISQCFGYSSTPSGDHSELGQVQ